MTITISNKHYAKVTDRDFQIGRGSPLGNPYTHLNGPTLAKYKCNTRHEAVEQYKLWLTEQMLFNDKVAEAMNQIAKMAREPEGVNLVCYCKPAECHGDIIKQFIESVYKG
ncbi:MAG: DUF4326 domain-containing protein [Ignavibacteriaceae bacterium]|jgi:hypothetical protein|nr:DUF4326 domain-containing protein [Ignavibacteriaceae bacterium]